MILEIIFIGVALSILYGAISLMMVPLNDSKLKENNDPLEPIRNSHPELKEIQPGEELMSVNFQEQDDIAEIAYDATPNVNHALSRQQTLSHLLSLEREGVVSSNGLS